MRRHRIGMDKWICAGKISIDSGMIVITDPMNINCWRDDEFDERNKTDVMGYNGASHATLSEKKCGQLKLDSGMPYAAVAISSGLGDGIYEVQVKIGPVYTKSFSGERVDLGDRIKEIRMKLI